MPQLIGRFEIQRELGRGTQSIVYLCNDPHLQREVAIKTLHFAEADDQVKQSLLAEARTVGKLRHPNIVPIFEAGEQEGDPYLVFEYVEGGTLAQLLREKPLTPVRAVEIAVAVLDALGQAHAQGVIHRDLKPSNILIDAKGTPRVMDFGIAVSAVEGQATQEKGLMGSPPYMAPEYVRNRTINVRTDLYAVGLILLEMLTGRRAVQAENIQQMLARIVREPVRLPPDGTIDERLGGIILKAVAPDPELRYASAQQMQQALEAYLDIGTPLPAADNAGNEDKKQGTLDFLLRRMRHKSDFPALSDSVLSINKLTDTDKESINKLSNTILKDFSLTNKILRLVNSAFYGQAGGGTISTVSRAVVVLGIDAVRNIAITVLLFEHLQNKANAALLKEAFLRANLSALLAREIGHKMQLRETEEAYICALFHGLGHLLAQFYFPEEVEEIRKLMALKNCSEEAAVRQVLGLSFEELGIGIARSWGFPHSIINSMRRLPAGPVSKPATRDEMLHVAAGIANELSEAIADTPPAERQQTMRRIAVRYANGIQFPQGQLQATLDKSFDELGGVAAILRMNLKQSPLARQIITWSKGKALVEAGAQGENADLDTEKAITVLGDTVLGEATEAPADGGPAVAVPDDACTILSAGIQDISNSLVEDFSLNDLLRITLETMYRGMGFKRVLFCLREPKSGQMVGRFGFGPATGEILPHFRFSMGGATDVFGVAVARGVDILINDINDPGVQGRVPDWYRQYVPGETFALFPLRLKGVSVGLIYCDKDKAGEIVIPPRELSLLKTLRNQALLALKQAG